MNNSVFNNGPEKIVFIFAFVFSGFFLTKIGISPYYIFTLLALYIQLCITISTGRFHKSFLVVFLLLTILAIILSSQMFNESVETNRFLLLIFTFASPLLILISRKFDMPFYKMAYNYFVCMNLLLFAVDAIWRFSHPGIDRYNTEQLQLMDEEGMMFYLYKYNSLMYLDSNFVAIQALALFSFISACGERFNKNYRILLLLVFVMTVLTLSRSAIVAEILFYIFVRSWQRGRKNAIIGLALLGLIGAFFSVYFLGDKSLLTKFDIFWRLVDYVNKASIGNLASGVGLGEGVRAIGMGTHSLFPTLIIETGFVGLLVFLILSMTMIFKIKNSWMILVPYVFAGFSFAPLLVPYLYCAVIFLYKTQGVGYESTTRRS